MEIQKEILYKKIDYKNPVKLGFVLNLSVFYYEVVGNKGEACKLAEDILSKSKETIDEEEDEVKDAMSIVNLLEENIGMWKVENDE